MDTQGPGDTTFPLHLLRLASPGLPVGGFSYSRGLEAAVRHGWVNSEASAREWIHGTLEHAFALLDAPLFLRMMAALAADDRDAFLRSNAWLAASRESREIQAEDRLMGDALLRLLSSLEIGAANRFGDCTLSYPAAFAIAAHHWRIVPRQALRGLMWAMTEGQVSAAIRLVPLGQTSGQRILIDAVDLIERSARQAERLGDDEIGNTAIGLAMASAWHEEQYSRLFRS
ncbi:urease accessory protein UreF [Mesorhizobium sp. L-8-3]|uniref:urease accessory protein UreF n=1 Tax=Mesorhizobium sp. L-8-3 TaxID=2744522 RepID=UPI001936509F|nr:urease accessory UreF family protein [Mesorhizobium sp. L-8-3]BCH24736.1 urease accessory protein UreF [Mesorhizobium sp. L-8-3]